MEFESSIDQPAITEYPLPSALRGDYSAIHHSSIWIDSDELIVGWVGPEREVRLARRLRGQAFEDSVNISAASGTVFGSPWTLDSHNYIAVAKCEAGLFHVAGDMHAVPLKYMRSASIGSMTNWRTGMIGTEESSVTYPQFIKAKSGTLYFFYREGGSGDGDWYLNKWNATAATWSRVARVHDGSTDGVSAYPHEVAVDPSTGRWHMLWTIRKSFRGIAENEHIYYAYSDDEGVTWKKTNGMSYALPIRWATGDKIVNLPGGSVNGKSIANGGQTAVDANGRPQSVWLVEDDRGVFRYRHVWLDGSNVWHYDTLLPTTNSGGRVPGLVCWPDGRRWMVFQTGAGGRRNTLRYFDIDAQTETIIRNTNMLNYLPVVRHSRERDVLYVLAPYERQDGLIGGEPADIEAEEGVPLIAIR